MHQINELSGMLNQHFGWHKAKMDCFVGMLIALLQTRTVNLTQLAVGFPSSAKPESRYRRIQRFLHEGTNYDKFALFIMLLFGFAGQNFYLTMDRTNWKEGQEHINILMLAIVYKGTAIPIMWLVLNNKSGNSTMKQRIALMKRFIKLFGKKSILGIFGDREFIGSEWLAWLKSEEIDFHIRIKKNALVPNSRGKLVQAKNLFLFLKAGESIVFEIEKMMTDTPVYLAGMRLPNGDLLIVASGHFCSDAISIYGKRWEIETLFGCLKTRGFRLEDTHINKRQRIKKLLLLPAIAFCWAHRTGEWKNEIKPIKVKKHERLAQSLFRVGLDSLRDGLLNFTSDLKSFATNFFQFIEIKNDFSIT